MRMGGQGDILKHLDNHKEAAAGLQSLGWAISGGREKNTIDLREGYAGLGVPARRMFVAGATEAQWFRGYRVWFRGY